MYTANANGASTNTTTKASAGVTSATPVGDGWVSEPSPAQRRRRGRVRLAGPAGVCCTVRLVRASLPDSAMALPSSCGPGRARQHLHGRGSQLRLGEDAV